MNKSTSKIKINDDLLLIVLGNKLIFQNTKKEKNYHHTISYGNKSGYFDLHLKNEKSGKYFTVIKMSHQNILEVLPQLLNKIFNSFLNLKKAENSLLIQKDFELFEINEIGDLTNEFTLLTKKNRIVVNQNSAEFNEFLDLLIKKHKTTKTELCEIVEKSQFHGIGKSPSEYCFLIKSPYLGNEIFILNDIDLSIESVLSKILGIDIYKKIIDRINEGIIELEN